MFKNLYEIFSTEANLNFACLHQGWETFTVLQVTCIAQGHGWVTKTCSLNFTQKYLHCT